jgi:predicted phosphoribosyltransferase
MRLANREAAAMQLAQSLAHYRGRRPLVLAVPTGGVPMGRIIADELGGDLDVVLVHRLRDEHLPDVAIGAVAEDGEVVLDAYRRTTDDWVAREREVQRQALQRTADLCASMHPRVPITGRDVIVVDDGVASGCTLGAALRCIRRHNPSRVVVAVGVSPQSTKRQLVHQCDEWFSVITPTYFSPVDAWYEHFPPVSRERVAELIGRGTPVAP